MSDTVAPGDDDKIDRLIDWHTETLLNLLKQIAARRSATRTTTEREQRVLACIAKSQSRQPLEEVQEIIKLPDYNANAVRHRKNPESIELGKDVVDQVRDYVTVISGMYRNNAFHNFEHASHVTMSVTKLLSRIVAPKQNVDDQNHDLHDHTYGVTSDPLTQFSCAFSALIHDVDHSGVPNSQLIREKHPLTALFSHRSIAEQYALVLSWDLLMEDRFKDFRSCMYRTDTELMRFRHLVVNGLMATDVADKDLKNLRDIR